MQNLDEVTGSGLGDMLKVTYDPANKATQLAADNEVAHLGLTEDFTGTKSFTASTTNFRTVTVQPLADNPTGTLRRFSATQTNYILQLQKENNDFLAGFNKDGNLEIDEVLFNTSPTLTDPATGKLYWNTTHECLSVDVEQGSIELGKEVIDYYIDLSGVGIEGDIVSVAGVSGNRVAVNLTDGTSLDSITSCIGVITYVGAANKVRVTKIGTIHDINTDGLTEGNPIYLDVANPGKFTQTKPITNYLVDIGVVKVAHLTQGAIDISIRFNNILKTTEFDVVKTNATLTTTDNSIARYNGTSGKLQNSGLTITDQDLLNLPKESNKGIFVDGAYGWDDLVGGRIVQITGVNAPTLETYKTGVLALAYNASDIQSWEFHLNHEEVIGGNKFLHVHTRHNGTGITGNLVIDAVIAYNYGHNRAGSPTTISKTFTVTPAQMPQYETHIEDILIAQSGGGAGLFDSDNWLPDDDILATFTVTTLPTITGGTTPKVFIPFCDIHRQVSGKSTKNPVPNFYGA